MTDFPPASQDDWIARVAAVLKGEAIEKLVSVTSDGIRIEPLYVQRQGPRVERPALAPWAVFQRVDHPEPEKADTQALDDLAHGANGLSLVFAASLAARSFGLPDALSTTIAKALADVELHAIGLRLDAGAAGRQAAQSLAEIVRKRPLNPGLLDIAFGMDPVGVLAHRGFLDESWSERAKLIAQTVAGLSADFSGPFVEADGRIWHEKGASAAQELGAVLASSIAYLRAFEALGDEVIARSVGMTLAADQDMFMTLAKFRAARLLWSRILEASGLPDRPVKLHAETSWRMMASLDPHTNILREVAACFGAGLGGADSITVLPFSLVQGLPNSFSRRVARNTQLVLLEESNLWQVSDPASGSGYVEHLTQEFCEKSWAFLQKIERQGGIVQTLQTGWLDGEMNDESGTDSLPKIGTTAYRLDTEHVAEIERSAIA
jgi:methylmalonyl-CoA mutase